LENLAIFLYNFFFKEKEKKGLDYDDLNSTYELKLENPSKRNGPTPLKGKKG
jgi:hypothetical protein